ncbi:hypothetical protein GCM10010277_14250 [Streptomyces longisporoflavus]|nr:hypothetical protein GCM10010277_14250 [Streptomyces longisporoflavus]
MSWHAPRRAPGGALSGLVSQQGHRRYQHDEHAYQSRWAEAAERSLLLQALAAGPAHGAAAFTHGPRAVRAHQPVMGHALLLPHSYSLPNARGNPTVPPTTVPASTSFGAARPSSSVSDCYVPWYIRDNSRNSGR